MRDPVPSTSDAQGALVSRREGDRFGWAGAEAGWHIPPTYSHISHTTAGWALGVVAKEGVDLLDLDARPPTRVRLPCAPKPGSALGPSAAGVVLCAPKGSLETLVLGPDGVEVGRLRTSGDWVMRPEGFGPVMAKEGAEPQPWVDTKGEVHPGPAPWLACAAERQAQIGEPLRVVACVGEAVVATRAEQAGPGGYGLWADGGWRVAPDRLDYVAVGEAAVAFLPPFQGEGAVPDGGRFTLYDLGGKALIDDLDAAGPEVAAAPEPESLFALREGAFAARRGDTCGWLDAKGEVVGGFTPRHTACGPLSGGHAWVGGREGGWERVR